MDAEQTSQPHDNCCQASEQQSCITKCQRHSWEKCIIISIIFCYLYLGCLCPNFKFTFYFIKEDEILSIHFSGQRHPSCRYKKLNRDYYPKYRFLMSFSEDELELQSYWLDDHAGGFRMGCRCLNNHRPILCCKFK